MMPWSYHSLFLTITVRTASDFALQYFARADLLLFRNKTRRGMSALDTIESVPLPLCS
jgi:hypothetical protein